MSAFEMIDSGRLARARKITSKNVLEFNIVKEDPLVVYCIIQGSVSDPYIIIIDTEDNYLSHWCPDFSGTGRWCKHIGKTLLLLEERSGDLLKQVSRAGAGFKYVSSRNNQEKQLEEVKKKLILATSTGARDSTTTGGTGAGASSLDALSVEDHARLVFDVLQQGHPPGDSITALGRRLEASISEGGNDERWCFRFILGILEMIPKAPKNEIRDKVMKMLGDDIRNAVQVVTDSFIAKFWTLSTIYRMECAQLLARIHSITGDKIDFGRLKAHDMLREHDLLDGRIVLDLLFHLQKDGWDRLDKTLADKLDFDDRSIKERLGRLLGKINFAGTTVPEIVDWISLRTGTTTGKAPPMEDRDDIFIYLLEARGKKVEFRIRKQNYRDFSYLAMRIIKADPLLSYVIDHILESERDYITNNEIARHEKLIAYLNGKKQKWNWVERPRNRATLFKYQGNGLIVQWDVNVKSIYPEFLMAMDGNRRLVPEPSSPLFPELQPYDYTLVHETMVEDENNTFKCNPICNLTASQVAELVKDGTRIVSNVLPWDILHDFYVNGIFSGDRVALGISHCDDFELFYGATILKDELKKIRRIGKAGINEDDFLAFKQIIRTGSGRLNNEKRAILRKIRVAEGHVMQALSGLIDGDEENVLKVLANSLSNSNDIQDFRETFAANVIFHHLNEAKITKVLDLIDEGDLGYYDFIGRTLKRRIGEELEKVERLTKRRKDTVGQYQKLLLGTLILRKAGVARDPSDVLSSDEKSRVTQEIKRIKEYF